MKKTFRRVSPTINMIQWTGDMEPFEFLKERGKKLELEGKNLVIKGNLHTYLQPNAWLSLEPFTDFTQVFPDLAVKESFEEVTPELKFEIGDFVTPKGKFKKLVITTETGEVYTSALEKMLPIPGIVMGKPKLEGPVSNTIDKKDLPMGMISSELAAERAEKGFVPDFSRPMSDGQHVPDFPEKLDSSNQSYVYPEYRHFLRDSGENEVFTYVRLSVTDKFYLVPIRYILPPGMSAEGIKNHVDESAKRMILNQDKLRPDSKHIIEDINQSSDPMMVENKFLHTIVDATWVPAVAIAGESFLVTIDRSDLEPDEVFYALNSQEKGFIDVVGRIVERVVTMDHGTDYVIVLNGMPGDKFFTSGIIDKDCKISTGFELPGPFQFS